MLYRPPLGYKLVGRQTLNGGGGVSGFRTKGKKNHYVMPPLNGFHQKLICMFVERAWVKIWNHELFLCLPLFNLWIGYESEEINSSQDIFIWIHQAASRRSKELSSWDVCLARAAATLSKWSCAILFLKTWSKNLAGGSEGQLKVHQDLLEHLC